MSRGGCVRACCGWPIVDKPLKFDLVSAGVVRQRQQWKASTFLLVNVYVWQESVGPGVIETRGSELTSDAR